MSAILIGGDESVKITFPSDDDWGDDGMIAVVVGGEQVGAWSIVEDPRTEAEACARSYSAVYHAVWEKAKLAGIEQGLRLSKDAYRDEVEKAMDRAAERTKI